MFSDFFSKFGGILDEKNTENFENYFGNFCTEVLESIYIITAGDGERPHRVRTCIQHGQHLRRGARQTLDGSFSAVWTATIASKDAFFCIFRALQDLHSFAPLQSQNLQIFCKFFRKNFRIFSDFAKFC